MRSFTIFAAVLAALLVGSHPRTIGDGAEYLAVATNLSRGERPSLSRAQVESAGLSGRLLYAPDGRIDTIHFWAYPAVAAVPLAVVNAFGGNPAIAFLIVNLAVLLTAAALAARRLSWPAMMLVFLSPALWWTDKVHTEIFTFGLIALAMCALPRHPMAAAVSLGLATAQNPPLVVLLALSAAATAVAGAPWGKVLPPFGAGALIAATHPLYYAMRYGRPFPLAETTATRLSPQSLGAVLFDSNIGLLFNDPFLPIAVAVFAAFVLARRAWTWTPWPLAAAASAAVLLSVFGRVVNINHGGTPGMSRHAVWLIPLAIPFLPDRTAPRPRVTLAVLAICGALWSIAYYRPSLDEQFLEPTRAARWLWSRHPSWTNPVPEVFAERLRHRENVLPGPAATPDCAKILLWDGIGPPECGRMAVPAKCQIGPCYANRRREGTYQFVVAPPAYLPPR